MEECSQATTNVRVTEWVDVYALFTAVGFRLERLAANAVTRVSANASKVAPL